MSTEAIQAPIRGHRVGFEPSVAVILGSREVQVWRRAHELTIDHRQALAWTVSFHHRNVLLENVVVDSCSPLCSGQSEHCGVMIEVMYHIAERMGKYRHVFHLVLNHDGLTGRLFTQSRQYFPR